MSKFRIKAPEPDREVISKILAAASKGGSACITWHARPDGDAVGGGLALRRILSQLGLEAELVSPTPYMEHCSFLPGFEKIRIFSCPEEFDLVFVIDCSDSGRLEGMKGLLEGPSLVINIDHHQKNSGFGDINYVRPGASSVCELIMNIASEAGTEVESGFALCIYTGLITDTNRFQEQNTTPRTHLIAAELIENHVSPIEAANLIYGNEDIRKLRLTARAIDTIRISETGRVGYIVITPGMLESAGMKDGNIEGIINYARNIKGVEVGILFRKIPGLKGVKTSFRSKGKVDVARVAGFYGGGGHHNAAGCLIPGEFAAVIPEVVRAVEMELERE